MSQSLRCPFMMACLPFLLSACAGGGHIATPEVVVPQPILKALDKSSASVKLKEDASVTSFTTGDQGKIEKYTVTSPGWIPGTFVEADELVYTGSDGKSYQFGKFNTLVLPSQASPGVHSLPTLQPMQATDNGGKIIFCCNHNTSTGMKFTELEYSRFGVWVSPNGEANLFSGGELATVNALQGSYLEGSNGQASGKATYQVVGFRSKGDQVATSTFKTQYTPLSFADPVEVSKLTVNFNTGKLGGEIIGNSDFGSSVTMQDVNVNGNRFSGTALSGGVAGKVEGALFGKETLSYFGDSVLEPSGSEIGGKVTFSGHKALDTVFGGIRQSYDAKTTSQDLTPLK